MPDLVAIALPGGPGFVEALRRVWHDGDAALPLDGRLPPSARRRLLTEMAPARLIDATGEHDLEGARSVRDGDALVVATSGSTGRPKGVVLTHDAVRASATATHARLGLRADDQWLACLPLAHVGGLSVVTRALLADVPLTVLPGFDPGAVTAAAVERGCTLVSLVATTLQRIDPTLFRVILLGGARPPEERPPNAITTYGMTETGSGVVYDGVPLDGVEVRLENGEVWLRGPMLLRTYRTGAATGAAERGEPDPFDAEGGELDPLDSEGWLATGDLGHWHPDGRLHVEGRAGDLIITGGENVWPEPVEDVLASHPGVADIAVAGRPDPEWGQRVVAFVVASPSGPPTLAALRSLVKEHLPAYCAPQELVVVATIERTNLGKVRRAALL